ncbi:unnamed protein product [Rotaria sp. Silwood2]|nr:unnamed protein product [Rotaria sp. Silwood2]CAF3445191.1 unnamed protein product [Rotaria sp. Silwood2]CAF3994457.1 unnamed protein product [Rotaria sp. Silwood2]CAF4567033.1 unnamed protein product [Rotaria sp. Silwood2]
MNVRSGEQDDFLAEGQLAIDDIADGIVANKDISKCLNNPIDISIAYMNIKSKSNKEYCIELSQKGYQIVGYHFDYNSQLSFIYYESLQEKLFQTQYQLEQSQDSDDDDQNSDSDKRY